MVAVEAGFCVSWEPDTVRSPDIAFVRAERIPPGGVGRSSRPLPTWPWK